MTDMPVEISCTCPRCGQFIEVPVAFDPSTGAPSFDVDAALEAHVASAHAPTDPSGSSPMIPLA